MRIRKRVALPLLLGSIIALAFAVNALASHSRPLGASKDRIVFVPAFKQCSGAIGLTTVGPANSTHGGPLSDPSCADLAPFGGSTTGPQVATDNAFGPSATPGPNIVWNSSDALAKGRGSAQIEVRCFDPTKAPTDPAYWTTETPPCGTTPGDNMDIFVGASATDVECAPTASTGTSCGSPNAAGKGPDYTGKLILVTTIRITDHWNKEPGGSFVATGTKNDSSFGVGIQCVDTPGDPARGGLCLADTSANQVVPGVTTEGKRGDVELGQVSVIDMGDDGAYIIKPPPSSGACPPSCAGTGDEVGAFLRMGIFSP